MASPIDEITWKNYIIQSLWADDPRNIQEIRYDLWEAEQKLKEIKRSGTFWTQDTSQIELYRLWRMHGKKDQLQQALSEGIRLKITASKRELEIGKQEKTVDLWNGNNITINQEEQSIWIGNHKFCNFDEVLSLSTDKKSSPSTKSQKKSGFVLIYAIACYAENPPHRLPIPKLMEYYHKFRDTWTKRDLVKKKKKITFDKNDTDAAKSLLIKCWLTISFEIDKELWEIRIKST